jgi:hypothetical protein
MHLSRRAQIAIAILGLAMLALYAWSSGYRVGKDIAIRENQAS